MNHNGDIHLAKKLIDKAKEAGADYIKFQTFKTELLVSPDTKKANYQKKNMQHDSSDNQFEMLKKLELSEKNHSELISYCNEKNINFLSTPFDLQSIKYLNSLNLDFFKVPSGEITNYPYLKSIARNNKPIILSTGMASLNEINDALKVLILNGVKKDEIIILHCNTDYPTSMSDVNLNAMLDIKEHFGVRVGYSDHTEGIEVAIAAVALGACLIEKHFTLDKNFEGPDHKASLDPNELKNMIQSIRNIEFAIQGSGRKEPSESEIKNKIPVRKSLFIKDALKKGEIIKENNLMVLRPGDGISPMKWKDIIGKKVNVDYPAFSKLNINEIF